MFWFKKTFENVLPTYSERLLKLESRVVLLEADILDLATAQSVIRNKVLRKIQFKKEDEEEREGKDLYGGMLLPEK